MRSLSPWSVIAVSAALAGNSLSISCIKYEIISKTKMNFSSVFVVFTDIIKYIVQY